MCAVFDDCIELVKRRTKGYYDIRNEGNGGVIQACGCALMREIMTIIRK